MNDSGKRALILGDRSGLGVALARAARQRGYECDMDTPTSSVPASREPDWLFWVTPGYLSRPLTRTSDAELEGMVGLHLTRPLAHLRDVLRDRKGPVGLVVVASVSSWRLREDEALYCGLRAAQACIARNLAVELRRDLPGSFVTLIHPGGLEVAHFHHDESWGDTPFLDPDQFASLVWDTVLRQTSPFEEWHIMRQKPWTPGDLPVVTRGPRVPETL